MSKIMSIGFSLHYYYEYNLSISVNLEIDKFPHFLITGSSGSGKSYCLLFLLGKLLQADSDIEVYFCDFKNSNDFEFLKHTSHYYAGRDCYHGVMDYYKKFSDVRENGCSDKMHILIFDEYPAFINYMQMQDKINKSKCANEILGAVSEILMLGRGISFGVWIVTQRADSALFSNGARDNFMVVIGLGNLSKEQRTMLFSGYELPDIRFGVGEGLVLADGLELTMIKYPMISDASDWKTHILRILNCSADDQ